jgi:hypothetical protein
MYTFLIRTECVKCNFYGEDVMRLLNNLLILIKQFLLQLGLKILDALILQLCLTSKCSNSIL